MSSTFRVLQAVSSVMLRRAARVFGLIMLAVLGCTWLLLWALAHYLSAWWWLGLLICIPLLLIAAIIYLLMTIIARRLETKRLTAIQQTQLNRFVDTIQRLLETRGMGWPLFVALNVKDLLIHREPRTIKELIDSTKTLRQDFRDLKQHL